MLQGKCLCGTVGWIYPLRLESVTACNCELCRRYGALWLYGYLDEGIQVSGATVFFERGSKSNGFHFCPTCGCVTHYMSRKPDKEGRVRIAVNSRMAIDPDSLMDLPIDHFDGRDDFIDLPRDGRCVKDLWF